MKTKPLPYAETQTDLGTVLGVNVATLRKWVESNDDFPGWPGFYPVGAALCWLVCFSPQQSEQGRDDYLHELITRMVADAKPKSK